MGILLLRGVMVLSVALFIVGHLIFVGILSLGILAAISIRNLASRYDKEAVLKTARKNKADGINPIIHEMTVITTYPTEAELHSIKKLLAERLVALKSRNEVQGVRLLDYEISGTHFLMLIELSRQIIVFNFLPLKRQHSFFYAYEINSRTREIKLLGDQDILTGKYHEDLGKMIDLFPGWLAKEILGKSG